MTTTATLPVTSAPPVHEHAWTTESAHRTSDGVIAYVRCSSCGTHRVDLRRPGGMPPIALSRATQVAEPRGMSTIRSAPVASAVTAPPDAEATSATSNATASPGAQTSNPASAA